MDRVSITSDKLAAVYWFDDVKSALADFNARAERGGLPAIDTAPGFENGKGLSHHVRGRLRIGGLRPGHGMVVVARSVIESSRERAKPTRNERILEHGYQAYAAEEGHYDPND